MAEKSNGKEFYSNPKCSICHSSKRVACLGGGSQGRYAYMCQNVECMSDVMSQWQQICPRDLKPGDDPQREAIRRALPGQRKRGRANGGGYLCSKCG